MLKKTNLWMSLLLIFTLMTSGLQTAVLAADNQLNQGTVTVIGTDANAPLLPQTTIPLTSDETATDALIGAVGAENVEFTDTDYGKMLSGIKGLKADGTNYWAFFINGVAAQVGTDGFQVQSGDHLTFRYTDWTKTPEKTVSLKVSNKDKTNINDTSGLEVIGTPNAFQLLQVVLGTDKVGYSETQYGKMITSINGIEATGTNYWAFYVNGKMAEVGADSYPLQANDQIIFQLESWEDNTGDTGTDNSEPGTPDTPAGSVSKESVQNAVKTAGEYVLKSEIGEWQAVALKQAGIAIPESYLPSVKALVKEKAGKFARITDTERYVLGILAAGGDPTNVEGYNLVEGIYNGKVTKQGLIGVSYALLALDSANFEVPDTAQWTRDKLLTYLMTFQNADGGWAWDESSASDPDTTAMILTSLAPYQQQDDVKDKVTSAVHYLSTQYQEGKIDNSSTAAQIVISLSALGIDSNTFIKDGTSLIQYLMTFQNTDGGFDWQGGEVSDAFSTAQGFQAIVAYQLFLQGKSSLYQLPLEAQATNDQTTGETKKTENESNKGKALPDTATNLFTLLEAGVLLLLVGGFFSYRQKKQKA